VAEYMAVAAALAWFLPYASVNDYPSNDEIEILSDSQLVVNQLNGEWRVRHSNVKPIAAVTHLLIEQLNQLGWVVKATWIPREENRLADKLSRRATNEGLKDRLPLTRREESE
jgi:ribonuclease HI